MIAGRYNTCWLASERRFLRWLASFGYDPHARTLAHLYPEWDGWHSEPAKEEP